MLTAAAVLLASTNAINSAQWSSGFFAGDLLQLSQCVPNYPQPHIDTHTAL